MRNTFIKELTAKASENSKIVLLIGDLGYNAVEPFFEKHPGRAFNLGIAEQNMAGVAAGLAATGMHVFTYSIGNFPTFRAAEQIRNDIAYHNLPVTIVSVGGGLSYGSLGYSHHTIQDYGLLRLFPNLVILSPCDPLEVEGCIDYIIEKPQPSYLRIGKTNEKIFTSSKKLKLGGVNVIKRENNAKAILTTGTAIQNVPTEEYRNMDIYSLPIWSEKAPAEDIEKLLSDYETIFVVEDHIRAGGFFSWILERLSRTSYSYKFKSISLDSKIIGAVGSQRYLQSEYMNQFKDN